MSDVIAYLAARSLRAPVAAPSVGEPQSSTGMQPRPQTFYEPGSIGETGQAEFGAIEDESAADRSRDRPPRTAPPRRVELKPEPREVVPPGSNSSAGMREPLRTLEPEPVQRAAAPKVEAPVAPRRAGVAEGSLPTAAERPTLQAANMLRSQANGAAPPPSDPQELPLSKPSQSSRRGSVQERLDKTRETTRYEEPRISPVKTAGIETPSRSLDAPAMKARQVSSSIVAPAPVSRPAAASLSPPPPGPASVSPRVQVRIGRIEIRATHAPAPQPPPQRREFGMSLEEYLAKRERG
jgi:hypothetical protein